MTTTNLLADFENRPSEAAVTTTGFDELDRITGGLRTGQVWILTGTPGQGRTTLLIQLAALLATTLKWPTRLVCLREPTRMVTSRLLSNIGRIPLLHLRNGRVADDQRLDHAERLTRAQQTLLQAPLHIATEGQTTFLDYDDRYDKRPLPPAQTVLIDDGDLSAGVSPERIRSFASRGWLVIVTLPQHLVVQGTGHDRYLDPAWAHVADIILEVRQAGWVGDAHSNFRPGEADLVPLYNRWGPEHAIGVLYQGHFSRFIDHPPARTS
jgi:replicative DNA helicase